MTITAPQHSDTPIQHVTVSCTTTIETWQLQSLHSTVQRQRRYSQLHDLYDNCTVFTVLSKCHPNIKKIVINSGIWWRPFIPRHCSYFSFTDPGGMEGWVNLAGPTQYPVSTRSTIVTSIVSGTNWQNHCNQWMMRDMIVSLKCPHNYCILSVFDCCLFAGWGLRSVLNHTVAAKRVVAHCTVVDTSIGHL